LPPMTSRALITPTTRSIATAAENDNPQSGHCVECQVPKTKKGNKKGDIKAKRLNCSKRASISTPI
jgi:hypothetical protein